MSSKKPRDIFDYFDELFKEMEEEIAEFERRFSRSLTKGDVDLPKEGPYFYGFRVTIGPDGKPKIQEFGNVKKAKGRPILSEDIEPVVDVIERDDEVRVIAEVPGVDKDKIKLTVSGSELHLEARGDERNYSTDVDLPAEVDENSAKASYKNGVLEVVLKKKQKKPTGKEIKIE
ncbi:heat-shock protein Hsp20 [Sulfodiicoccus acidiphilus]|uniref:Heat-shock protein Hsp20 n=1 Tax=Sulfodiicoccus acidiphilus TaxID=1670455 RepID=A0A348B3T4_9CREN|nr:archaeal heat shock protein Hsp20 [Sulfodiicoccus acidiphilus]BBD72836.1 heat-shock protein Hsp20 [Sulfodiicoccus acidiphilus]GGT88604.1 heat-shock protein Hsp20 [Sulfodiicoccus acidiphilus]